ncbi:hypothetical protein [Rubinisphaera sp.]|uniref:hypothetical protein n=1 Tax=Rubinisphaera sp. TaxID=2024857 RepID=UPI000C0F82E7|nr:hypothetical protein [Rubinisphaera sp.]MBV07665.1 hypothetical protein [Rubinisphaera sp.]HCS53270.1 hypothetical protein [Planctomycetaceae bacterium]|tara:strand:- start:214 stop:441 length:228 start_codon:yes stop_codon:yes gene_type:complete
MKLTKFQKHVLQVMHAIGPTNYQSIQAHCRQPRKAIKKAVYRLRLAGLASRVQDEIFDVSENGKIKTIENSSINN